MGDATRRAAGTSRDRLPNTRRIDAPGSGPPSGAALKADGLSGALMNWDELTDDAGWSSVSPAPRRVPTRAHPHLR